MELRRLHANSMRMGTPSPGSKVMNDFSLSQRLNNNVEEYRIPQETLLQPIQPLPLPPPPIFDPISTRVPNSNGNLFEPQTIGDVSLSADRIAHLFSLYVILILNLNITYFVLQLLYFLPSIPPSSPARSNPRGVFPPFTSVSVDHYSHSFQTIST